MIDRVGAAITYLQSHRRQVEIGVETRRERRRRRFRAFRARIAVISVFQRSIRFDRNRPGIRSYLRHRALAFGDQPGQQTFRMLM